MKRKIFYIIILFVCLFPLISVGAEGYNNFDPNAITSCGGGLLTNIPKAITKVVRYGYIIIQVAVPVVLVVMGSLDLFKGITAGKEDEIKKGQNLFIKRLISAAVIFFVFSIVKVLISFAADNNGGKLIKCAECFLENKCDR